MKNLMDKRQRYERIIQVLCEYKGISREEILKVLKDKECKYLFYLLVGKYQCLDVEMIKKDFIKVSKKNLSQNIRKAEEMMLLNKKVRELYFQAEKIIEK